MVAAVPPEGPAADPPIPPGPREPTVRVDVGDIRVVADEADIVAYGHACGLIVQAV